MRGVVASVMHTGTWSTFEVVHQLTGYEVVPWVRACGLGPAGVMGPSQPFEWLQVHIPGHKHKDNATWLFRLALIETMVERAALPTVIPIRDPLLAIISFLNRDQGENEPGQGYVWVAEAFERAARLAQLPNVFVFPVDFYRCQEDRRALVERLAAFLGVDPTPATEIAAAWPRVNRTPDPSGHRTRYLASGAVPPELDRELRALRRSPTRRWLVDLGYDVPWMRERPELGVDTSEGNALNL